MQIATASTSTGGDDEEGSITMTIVPPTTLETSASAGGDGNTSTGGGDDGELAPESATQMLYAAVSACSNLHPDPILPGDEEYDDDEEGEGDDGVIQASGGLPPAMPGSSGWITAENMHEYFDEEGNWIAGGEEPSFPLGPGAGTVRQREGEDGGGQDQCEGVAEGEDQNDEAKWRRTD